jgi:excisionase family DNA binding protein
MASPENAPGRVNGPGDQVPPTRSKADDRSRLPGHSPDLQPLLKRSQAQEVLNVSARTLWSLTASGEIAHVRIGSTVRYRVEDLRAFIARHRKEVRRGQ